MPSLTGVYDGNHQFQQRYMTSTWSRKVWFWSTCPRKDIILVRDYGETGRPAERKPRQRPVSTVVDSIRSPTPKYPDGPAARRTSQKHEVLDHCYARRRASYNAVQTPTTMSVSDTTDVSTSSALFHVQRFHYRIGKRVQQRGTIGEMIPARLLLLSLLSSDRCTDNAVGKTSSRLVCR